MSESEIDEIDYTPMLPFVRYYGLADEVLEILTTPDHKRDTFFSLKIIAIKHVRKVTGWFLFESKKFVDNVEAIVDNGANIDLIAIAEKNPQRDYDNEASY